MQTLFLLSTLFGGTVFVLQFVLAVIGFGAEEFDVPDDLAGGDAVDLGGDPGDVADTHGSTWLFGVISFRTVVAALTFFGLSGLAASSGGLSDPLSLLIAVAAGLAAMYGVHYIMQALYRLRHDGTVRIERTVGERATVYIPIPPNHSGLGKIQIRTQGRIMEYAAQTHAAHRLSTGSTVRVVKVLSPITLEVEPVEEEAEALSLEAQDVARMSQDSVS